jgi:hypothetical protein
MVAMTPVAAVTLSAEPSISLAAIEALEHVDEHENGDDTLRRAML